MKFTVKLLDLPWHDILSQHIFNYLSIPQLFILREVCKDFQSCVELHFSNIVVVNLSFASETLRISPKAFKMLLYGNRVLKYLSLRSTKSWLTDAILHPVFDNCNQLQVLDMSGCNGITNDVVVKITANCHNISELILRDCHWLSRDSILSISMNCSRLTKLDLTACWQMNDEAIAIMASFLKNLVHLYLSKIYGITDESIHQISNGCKNLQTINLSGCWRVTDHAIKHLVFHCINLRCLQVRDCPNITEHSLNDARKKKIKLDVFEHKWQFLNHAQLLQV